MLTKKLLFCTLSGAFLGIFCIIGAQVRSGFERDFIYLFAFWYNRVLMGFAIGLAPGLPDIKYSLIRGAAIGAVVSFAFFASTGFDDIIGFIAGIVYGVIIGIVDNKVR